MKEFHGMISSLPLHHAIFSLIKQIKPRNLPSRTRTPSLISTTFSLNVSRMNHSVQRVSLIAGVPIVSSAIRELSTFLSRSVANYSRSSTAIQRGKTHGMSGDAKNHVILDRGNNTTCTINLHGATITSWKVTGEEQIFVSKKAIFDGETPIMGGIPIVFPKFANWGNKPFHGFARVCKWLVDKSPAITPDGDVKAVLKLTDNAWTREFWDYAFSLTYEVILKENELHTDITVFNPSPERTFAFDLLLHTYFKVPDVTMCEITGFKGSAYADKTKDFQEFVQETDTITVRKHTDNIYMNTAEEHVISNTAGGKSIRLKKSNYADTVVWNPWSDTVNDFDDLNESEYPHFFCVEAGNVKHPVHLAPGKTFKASQNLLIS